MRKAKRRTPPGALSGKEISEIRQRVEAMPELERASELFNVAGSAARLKLLYLLDHEKDLPVGEPTERVGVSMSAVSQHLAKLRVYGLVVPQRKPHRVVVSEVKEVVRIWTGEGGQQVL